MMMVTKTDIAERAAARLVEVGAPPSRDDLAELPSLFVTVLSDDVEAALGALSQVCFYLLASDTVDPYAGALLEPLCAAAGEAHPAVQADLWDCFAHVAGGIVDPASRDAHETFRPYVVARLVEQVLREDLGAPAVCSLAALAVAYPDWGRLAVPKLMARFEAAKPLTVVRAITGLGLLGMGVMRDDMVAHVRAVVEADPLGDVARELEDVLRPDPRLEQSNYWRLWDHWVLHAMHACVHGNLAKVTDETVVRFD